MGWAFWGLNPSRGRDFLHLSRPALGVKWLGHHGDHPPPSSAEVKGRVQLHLYSSSGPSWPAVGCILPYKHRHSILLQVLKIVDCEKKGQMQKVRFWEQRHKCRSPLQQMKSATCLWDNGLTITEFLTATMRETTILQHRYGGQQL